MRGIFHNFLKNAKSVFWGRNLFWHLLAIALTYILVISGFDWRYFQMAQNPAFQSFFWPAVELGAFVPLFGILIFYVISAAKKNRKAVSIALALGQAALLGFLTSEFYKFFTGRPGPPHEISFGVLSDTSHVFRFGFGRGGLFFGWPSSHATIAFAMAATLIILFPKNKVIGYLAIFYALYIGIGVSMTIHWFSDFAAGAIIGITIGTIVGKSFLGRQRKDI